MFEGNGYTISNLYTRGAGGVGLFGIIAESAEIRNVGLIDNNSYGGAGESVDNVGGLVGFSSGEIIASYATGIADGGGGEIIATTLLSAGWLASHCRRLAEYRDYRELRYWKRRWRSWNSTMSAGWLAGM